MFKFYRSVLTAGIVTLGLAACGDDVTITDPPEPPAPGVTSVSVAPTTATVAIGQSVVYAASVIADNGVSTAVTWTSSNPSIATVDGTGKVTGVALGTTTIIASSTADNGKTGIATIIVQANPPGVTSFTVSPATLTLAPGAVFQASANASFGAGVTPVAPVWSSSNAAVATVNPTTGVITAVAPGTATISAALTVGGQTVTGNVGLTVRNIIGAQISIQSITQGLTTVPVPLNNVAGQIEVNLNFDPGEQIVDSVAVFIGGKLAAKQIFGSSPAAGVLTMSVNTANFTKNVAAGTTTVDFNNGPSTVTAIVYPRGGAAVATQATQIILNNVSGWAANVIKPTTTGIGVPASSAIGQTFWGGPTAGGITTVQLFPVIYESGRSINTVTFGFGGCPTVVDATLPFTQSFGYTTAGATVNCTNYEWTGGPRDNVYVVSGIDNASNAFPGGGLIPNTIVFNSTPDSLRIDYKAPAAVTAPVIVGSEGYNWLNDAATIRPASPAILDVGVGGLLSSYVIVVGPSGSGTFPTTFTTVAALAETNTNCAAPTPGCDGYAARASGTDVLGNTSNSTVAATFGVDRTLPVVRLATGASIYAAGGNTSVTDSTTRVVYAGLYGVDAGTINFDLTDFLAAAAGTNDTLRLESIDNRAGLSRTVISSNTFAQGGATGTQTVNTACATSLSTDSLNFGAALVDGYRPTAGVHVTCGSAAAGYYTTTIRTVDRAGNLSTTYRRTLAIDPAPPQVTGVSPNANYAGNVATTFTIGVQDDLEVIDARLRIRYGNVLLGDGSTTAATALVWRYGFTSPFATRFDNSIINPFLGTLSLDMFTVSVQETCTAAGAPYAACLYRGDPVPVASAAVVKPDSVAVTVRDVWGSYANNIVPWNIPGRQTGVSAEFASPILSATVPAVGVYGVVYNGATVCLAGGTLNGPCVVAGINWRNFASTATTRTFRATEALSTTLPVFTRVDLFGLNAANEWVYIQRITVPAVIPTSGVTPAGAGTITGTDNGAERYWDFTFTNVVTTGFTQFRALGVNAQGQALFSTRMP